jgi:hypothetical protein
MSIKEVFGTNRVFLAVVHAEDPSQALENALIARYEGAHGIFLINHAILYTDLIACYYKVRERCPDLWIGLNCLDLGRRAIWHIPFDAQGLWADDGEVDDTTKSLDEANRFEMTRRSRGWKGLYFGGVAFKYHTQPANVGEAAQHSARFVDVITTSGPRTGVPPSIEKIIAMRSTIGNHPLAIASGITLENIGKYMPFVDCFLVATGISKSQRFLDPARMKSLAKTFGK